MTHQTEAAVHGGESDTYADVAAASECIREQSTHQALKVHGTFLAKPAL